MHYLLFIFYLLIFCFVLSKATFIKNSGLSSQVVIGLFLLKVTAGVAYGWINTHYIKGDDTFVFFKNSITETDLLLNDPLQYFKTFFISNYNGYGNFFGSSNSFWNDLRGTLLEKLLAIFNIFSFKNYYIDSLFFNFLVFFGSIALYRVFIKVYPKNSFLIIAGLFLIPSALYYTSGIHKDGLIFLGIAISIFNMYHIIMVDNKKVISYFLLLSGLLLIFFIRNFFFFAILPAFVCWFVSARRPKKTILIFLSGYCITGILFFAAHLISPSLDFPQKVADRQHVFLSMSWAKSYIPTDSLQPNILSFIKKTPEALNHALLRPYLTENYTIFYLAAAVEIIIFLLVFLLFVFFKKPATLQVLTPFTTYCIFFSISCFFIIGYTIPIIGAIVRYRSVFLPLFFIPVLANINWEKFIKLINNRK